MRKERVVNQQDQAYNPNCPACVSYRLHTEAEWDRYHPLRGHGYTKEQGYTHSDLARAAT